ncbi:autotransporter outer membrane beta-barrel domain-containing protein [Desulfovibrio aminophilus]|uniref:autotransporter outer membrane beta-barrel domain-containing protein n=1 Tax=Desulfovibrio aminophilus TaxID=81425 RepID=UPI000429D50E|nr:autotransporter domain-containing protein [Desulfovibrio aminophilus]
MKFRVSLLLACALCLAAQSAFAATQYAVGPFILNVRSAGESYQEVPPPYPPTIVTGDFSAAELEAIMAGVNVWVERVGGSASPGIIINLAKVADPSGTAYNYTYYTGRENPDLYDYLVNGQYHAPNPSLGYHTEVVYAIDYPATPTRLGLDGHLCSTSMAHELMHALGMHGVLLRQNDGLPWNQTTWTFDASSAWDSHLYDVNGVKGEQGSIVFDPAEPTNRSNGSFVLPDFSADPTHPMPSHPGQVSFFPTFHGPAVDALSNGKGLPLAGGIGADYRIDDGNVLGHSALLGSLMSCSPVAFVLFPELELAALKDMGYSVDLKQFFGKSYYPSNLGGFLTTDPAMAPGKVGAYLAETADTVVNTAGFNSAASFGTGLHVYRDKLNVTQAANIYASGNAAGGIRIDGVGNTLTIPNGITVSANGNYGTGLLVSYGKGNVINLNGVVEATGPEGVGAVFDTGSWYLSYYYIPPGAYGVNADYRYFLSKMNSDLNGPLVDSFNIAGSLTGSSAAIRIGSYAYVKAINIMRGAAVTGDIVNGWNPWDMGVSSSNTTALNVGVSDTAGTPDSAFNMRYDGDITGPASFKMNVAGGTFSYNGTYSGLAATVQAGATLKGNATYQLYADGTPAGQAAPGDGAFTNAGTVAPGNSIGTVNITGNFTNTGTLLMEFDARGQTDKLNVSGVFNHNTGAGAKVTVAPEPGYYSGTMAIPFPSMFSGGGGSTLPSIIDSFVAPNSPTLGMTMSAGPVYTVTTTRSANAYSQYATSSDAADLGRALDAIAGSAQSDMQQLFSVLDFSSAGGGTIATAMVELSPAAYNSSAQAALNSSRMLSSALLRAMQRAPSSLARGKNGGDSPEVWSAYAVPYGGLQQQRTLGEAPGYSSSDAGVFSVVEREYEDGLSAGFHVALTHRQVDVNTQAGGQMNTDGMHFGVQAQVQPNPSEGGYAHGLARVGIENNTSRRKVDFNGYQRTSQGEWIGLASGADVGAGYNWRVGPVSFGPVADLDYAFNWRPAVRETGGGGADLALDSAGQHSLHSALGGQLQTELGLDQGQLIQAGLRAMWLRDLLGDAITTRGSFADADGPKFSSHAPAPARDSLGLSAHASLLLTDGLRCGAFVGTELFRAGFSSVEGGLSFNWNF